MDRRGRPPYRGKRRHSGRRPGPTAVAQTVNITAETVTGRLYQAWYAPEVKREIKSVEENYDTNGVRSARFTNELESYKVAD